MFGITGADLLSVGGSLGGTLLSNSASSREGHRNRRFMQKMSNTAHQREVEDLRKAGLNPILSAGGRGASTPGSAMPTVHDLGKSFASGMMIASERKRLEASARETTARAGAAEVESELVRGAKAWLDEHPKVRDAVYGGLMGKLAGVPSTFGAGGFYTAKAFDYINRLISQMADQFGKSERGRLKKAVEGDDISDLELGQILDDVFGEDRRKKERR